MANPFFNPGSSAPNLMQMVGQLKQNPFQFLMQRRLNVPQSVGNDPNAILQHLVSSGQVSQQQINSAYQMASRMGLKK